MIERMHRNIMGSFGYKIKNGAVYTVVDGNTNPMKVASYKAKIYPAPLNDKEMYINFMNEDLTNPTYSVMMTEILEYLAYKYRVAIHAISETIVEYLNGNVPEDLPTKAIKALQVFNDVKGQSKKLIDETTADIVSSTFSPAVEYYTLGYEVGIEVDDEKYLAGVSITTDIDTSGIKRRKDKELIELLAFTIIPKTDKEYIGYSNNKHIPVLLSIIASHNEILNRLNKTAKMFMVDPDKSGLKHLKKIEFDYDIATLKAEAVEIPDVNVFTGATSITASIGDESYTISVEVDENKNGNNVIEKDNPDDDIILIDDDGRDEAINRLSKPVLKRKKVSDSKVRVKGKSKKASTKRYYDEVDDEEYEQEKKEKGVADDAVPLTEKVITGKPIPLDVTRYDEYDEYDDREDYYEDDYDDRYYYGDYEDDIRPSRSRISPRSRRATRRPSVRSRRSSRRPSVRSRYGYDVRDRRPSRRPSIRSRVRPSIRSRYDEYDDYDDHDSVFDDFKTLDI